MLKNKDSYGKFTVNSSCRTVFEINGIPSVPVMATDYMVMQLTAIDGRNPAIYDFTNTHASADRYDVDTGSLDLAGISVKADIVAWGFPTPFDNAGEDDVTARTLVQYPTTP